MQENSHTELTRTNRMENGIVHPVLRGSSALERRDSKSKGEGKLSKHFCGDDNTAELVLRKIISVSQLSIYGAVADMCEELACRISGCSESTGNFVAANRIVDNEQNASDH